MNKKQIEALVNKGAITHVGIAADLEKLSDKEICERYVTKHEVTAELLSGEDETPVAPEEPTPEPLADATPVEEATPVALSEELVEEVAPIEETTTAKKTSKKSKKVAEEVTEAPVVDPVTE